MFVVVSNWGVEGDDVTDAVLEWEKAMFEAFGGEMTRENMAETFAAVFQSDPAMKDAFERAGEQMGQMGERFPVQQVTYIVKAPLEAELDLDKVLSAEPKKKPKKKRGRLGRLRQMVNDAAEAQAQGQQEDPSGAVESQMTVMSVTTKRNNIRFIERDTADFRIPESFEEVQLGE
jgi:hypothetical protein